MGHSHRKRGRKDADGEKGERRKRQRTQDRTNFAPADRDIESNSLAAVNRRAVADTKTGHKAEGHIAFAVEDVPDEEMQDGEVWHSEAQADEFQGDDVRDHPPFDEPYRQVDDPDAIPPDEGLSREFFGMLTDEEHERFKYADEMIASNFAHGDPEVYGGAEQQAAFVEKTWEDARAVALKLACSQSHSRLMERLILRATTRQKKELFTEFAGHFLSLVTHRFASHCCEMLFRASAPVVTQELGGFSAEGGKENAEKRMQEDQGDGKGGEHGEEDEQTEKTKKQRETEPEESMEALFLLTLDELEQHLGYLMTDTYGSHSLRLLVLVLAGKPLEGGETDSLVRGKQKEYTTVEAAAMAKASALNRQMRAVPESFTMAVRKVIFDTTSTVGGSGIRALMESPTGNPIVQLLLELDMSLNENSKSKKDKDTETLLEKILPAAPTSLADATSPAAEWVSSAMYSRTASRVLEVIVTHGPEKIFQQLHANFFRPRLAVYLKNDIASFSVAKALKRYSKDALVDGVEALLPIMRMLVENGRFNVLKTVFERCAALSMDDQLTSLTTALKEACDGELVQQLCLLDGETEEDKKIPLQYRPNRTAIALHGAQLLSAMLLIPGAPATATQSALLSLTQEQLFLLATASMPSVTVLTTALSAPAAVPHFHKGLVSRLLPRMADMAANQFGHNFVFALAEVPSKDQRRSIPFHFKQTTVTQLVSRHAELELLWMGRKVWKAWRAGIWRDRPETWMKWAREVDAKAGKEFANKPWKKQRTALDQTDGGSGRQGGRQDGFRGGQNQTREGNRPRMPNGGQRNGQRSG